MNISRIKHWRPIRLDTHFFYENVLRHKTFTISKPNDSVINQHVNIPRRSMTGLLFLFTAPFTAGTRNSEKLVNQDIYITSVKIDIDGNQNMLYSRGMIPTDQYKSILQRLTGDTSVKEKDFYTNDKFALWIDLRNYSDNNIHIHFGSRIYRQNLPIPKCSPLFTHLVLMRTSKNYL